MIQKKDFSSLKLSAFLIFQQTFFENRLISYMSQPSLHTSSCKLGFEPETFSTTYYNPQMTHLSSESSQDLSVDSRSSDETKMSIESKSSLHKSRKENIVSLPPF